GPTQTIALQNNSEAIDFIPVADCTDQSSPTPLALTTDQRGLPRPDPGNPDFCDAGAYELQTTPFVLAPNSERLQIARSTTPNSDQVNMAFTLRRMDSRRATRATTRSMASRSFLGLAVVARLTMPHWS